MGKFKLQEEGNPSNPASGFGLFWFDNTASLPFYKDDAGRNWGRAHRASVTSQGAGFASDTYVTNSGLLIPSFGVQAQTVFEWMIVVSKTAAGAVAPIYQVRIGVNQTTADTSRLSITGPAQTAAIDNAVIKILVTVRNVGASGILQGHVSLNHDLAATGFAVNAAGMGNATGSAFDNSALQGQFVGLSINGGTSAAWTVTQAFADVRW